MIFLGVLGYGQKDAISFLFGDNDDSDYLIDDGLIAYWLV